MKRFTQTINETVACVTADTNPGNSLASTGLMNHYTPIQNIVTNIRNLFGAQLSFVTSVGEDGVSVKLNSSKFVNRQAIHDILDSPQYRDEQSSVLQYAASQGLNQVKIIPVGRFYVVYLCAPDLNKASDCAVVNSPSVVDTVGESFVCTELVEANINEVELDTIINEEETELKNPTVEKIAKLADSKDKVKAAKQLELLVTAEIELPREFYFAGIKFKNGDEAIALRWRYVKKLPTGKQTENTRSLLYIFGTGEKGIWVQDFAKDSLVKLPDDVEKLIRHILDILEASETDDPAIFAFATDLDDKSDSDKDKDTDKDTDKKDDDNESSKDSDDKDDKKDDSKDDKKDENSLL